MTKVMMVIFLVSFLISACAPGQMPSPTVPPISTNLLIPISVNSPTLTPHLTSVPLPTSALTPIPTKYPFSTLPGWLAYMDFECRDLCTNISIIRPDISGRKRLTDHDDGLLMSILWSPNGRYIAYQFIVLGENGGLQLRLFDLKTNQMSILTSHYIETVSGLSWSPDSRYLAIGYQNENGKNGEIQRMDVQDRQVVNLTNDLATQEIIPAWSPDGKTIAFSSKNPDGSGSIWLMDASGSNLQNITADKKWHSSLPSWSPSGNQIVYYRQDTENNTELCIMEADGSNKLSLDKLGKARVIETARWSPDGNFIGVVYGNEKETKAIIIDLRAGMMLDIPEKEGKYTGISWSPDSKALIYMGNEGDFKRSIYLFVFNGDKPFTVSSPSDLDLTVWSPVAELP